MTNKPKLTENTETIVGAEKTNSPLDNAPDDIKLAVDLIYLLENNNVEIKTAISALKIVLNDFENK
ncbi:pleiotropic regulatory protein RsmS [Aliivibrio sifiae]|jgi:hypothetical protein|uniref:Primosomal protein n=1 Tax=Aliivibrio sifiae TaxID=566293 RepID=A0A2S7XC79_9GAMM|nr:pleiotropic regulatory protein RsmS [Aliivibrio sifiae]PQJ88877.1 hypothetical protein BTO22_04460 [Aliivibrio sifiae]